MYVIYIIGSGLSESVEASKTGCSLLDNSVFIIDDAFHREFCGAWRERDVLPLFSSR